MKNKASRLIVTIILFLIAAAYFYTAFYVGFGAIQESEYSTGYRTIPAFVAYLLPTFVLISYHRISHAKSYKSMANHAKIDGYITVCLSFFVLVLDIVYFILNVYGNLVEGHVTSLWPLDTILLSLLCLGYGAYLLTYKKWKKENLSFYPSENPLWKRLISFIVKGFGVGFSLYLVGSLINGFGFANYDSPYFGATTPIYLGMIIIALLLAYDVFFQTYKDIIISKKANFITKVTLSIVSLAIVIALEIVFIKIPDIVLYSLQPYFRLDPIASLNIAPYALGIPPLVYVVYLWLPISIKERTVAE